MVGCICFDPSPMTLSLGFFSPTPSRPGLTGPGNIRRSWSFLQLSKWCSLQLGNTTPLGVSLFGCSPDQLWRDVYVTLFHRVAGWRGRRWNCSGGTRHVPTSSLFKGIQAEFSSDRSLPCSIPTLGSQVQARAPLRVLAPEMPDLFLIPSDAAHPRGGR